MVLKDLPSYLKELPLHMILALLWRTMAILGHQTMVRHSHQWLQVDQRHPEASQSTSQMPVTQVVSVLMAHAVQAATLQAVPSVLAQVHRTSRHPWAATRLLHRHLVGQAQRLLRHHRASLLQARASRQPRLHIRQHLQALVKVCRLHHPIIHQRRQAIRLRLQRSVHRLRRTTRRRLLHSVQHHLHRPRHRSIVLLLRCTARQVQRMVVELVQANSRQLRRITLRRLQTLALQARRRPRARHILRRARCTTLLHLVLAVSRVLSTRLPAQCILQRLQRKTNPSRSSNSFAVSPKACIPSLCPKWIH